MTPPATCGRVPTAGRRGGRWGRISTACAGAAGSMGRSGSRAGSSSRRAGGADRGPVVRRRGGRSLQHPDVREQALAGKLDIATVMERHRRSGRVAARGDARQRASTRRAIADAPRWMEKLARLRRDPHRSDDRGRPRRRADRDREIAGEPDAARGRPSRPGRPRGHDPRERAPRRAVRRRASDRRRRGARRGTRSAHRHDLADRRRAERADDDRRARPAVARRAGSRSGRARKLGPTRSARRPASSRCAPALRSRSPRPRVRTGSSSRIAFARGCGGRARTCVGAAVPEVVCFAGHDAGVLADETPAGMVLVRNATGISHSPLEDRRGG